MHCTELLRCYPVQKISICGPNKQSSCWREGKSGSGSCVVHLEPRTTKWPLFQRPKTPKLTSLAHSLTPSLICWIYQNTIWTTCSQERTNTTVRGSSNKQSTAVRRKMEGGKDASFWEREIGWIKQNNIVLLSYSERMDSSKAVNVYDFSPIHQRWHWRAG